MSGCAENDATGVVTAGPIAAGTALGAGMTGVDRMIVAGPGIAVGRMTVDRASYYIVC